MTAFAVGDLVIVHRASGVNEADARAVVVEAYTLSNRPGWTLLFPDGRADGFSPHDCDLFAVERIGHVPTLSRYRFRGMGHLHQDWRAGVFNPAFELGAAT